MSDDIPKIIELTSVVTDGHNLSEAMSPEDLARIDAKLASPDMRPNNFDITVEAWVARIDTWGKTTVTHVDPELRSKKQISTDAMVARLTDDKLLKLLGQFKIDQLDFNKVLLSREYKGMDGRKYKEEFIVVNDLSRIKQRMQK